MKPRSGFPADASRGRGPARPRVGRKPSRRRREATPAAEAISEALVAAGVAEVVRTHRIITEWRAMVGERIAARTWPDGLKDRVLWVRVASSAWLHELTLLKAGILAGIDRVLGEPRLVDDLRFHLGNRKQIDADDVLAMARQARQRRPPPPKKPLPPPATGAALTTIERDVAAVPDPELRELIKAVRVRHDR